MERQRAQQIEADKLRSEQELHQREQEFEADKQRIAKEAQEQVDRLVDKKRTLKIQQLEESASPMVFSIGRTNEGDTTRPMKSTKKSAVEEAGTLETLEEDEMEEHDDENEAS